MFSPELYENSTISPINIFEGSALKDYSFTTSEVRKTYWNYVREDQLRYLKSEERTVFFTLYLVIYVIIFASNISAIYNICGRKHRHIQKVCIISLALSDLIMATAYVINHLDTFSHELINWTLGTFMCKFIPMVQILGLIANCLTLVIIALDRYQNVVHALVKRWNPELWKCGIGIFFVWLVSGGLSVPMFLFFKEYGVIVVSRNNSALNRHLFLCITNMKDELYRYYISIASLIFLPMLAIFLWLYYQIAHLIWVYRKPLHTRFQKKMEPTSLETSVSHIRSGEEETINRLPNPTIDLNKKKNIHVERKIRTFKIVVVLMLVFILCRLPYWIFSIMKLENTYNEPYHWRITYILTGLTLINCVLNPFLYTFLNPTVKFMTIFCKVLGDFICRICCCCISNTEFEEFERENPFVIENYDRNSAQRSVSSHASTARNVKVKFVDDNSIKVNQHSYKGSKKY